MTSGSEVAARARALVGARFRPQGRSVEHGLDCVGLVALAAELPAELIPSGYSLRSEAPADLLSRSYGPRVSPVAAEESRAGDVLLVRAGPGQDHLLILVEDGFIHADARLGKVVERSGPVCWQVLAAWRVAERT